MGREKNAVREDTQRANMTIAQQTAPPFSDSVGLRLDFLLESYIEKEITRTGRAHDAAGGTSSFSESKYSDYHRRRSRFARFVNSSINRVTRERRPRHSQSAKVARLSNKSVTRYAKGTDTGGEKHPNDICTLPVRPHRFRNVCGSSHADDRSDLLLSASLVGFQRERITSRIGRDSQSGEVEVSRIGTTLPAV